MAVNDGMTLEQMKEKWPDNPHLEVKEVPRAERVKLLLDSYALGLAHGAPRSQAELDEIRALLAD